MKTIIILLTFLTYLSNISIEFRATENSYIAIHGTSSLHDWTMDTNKMDIVAEMKITDGQVVFNSFEGQIPVKSLKSGKSTMDNNVYKALKTNKHEFIKVKLIEIVDANPANKTVDGRFEVTVAGKTKEMLIRGEVHFDSTTKVNIKGTTSLLMTEFNVDPPSFMFGSLTTGNKIDVEFDIELEISKQTVLEYN